jgi:hypothetical protein
MLRLLADENFNNDIVRGLIRLAPELDIVRAQDVGLANTEDDRILAWSADQGRIVLTHDVSTMTAFAFERVAAGLSMPGVFQIGRTVSIGRAIEELLLLLECSLDDEWEGQVLFLPL